MTEHRHLYIDELSVCAVSLDISFSDTALGTATGFFFESNERIYLVSNWHVFSGREPATGQPKDKKNGLTPNHISLRFHPTDDLLIIAKMSIPLVNNDESPVWIQHKIHGKNVDVAAIEIDLQAYSKEVGRKMEVFAINKVSQVHDMKIPPGSDVVVLGFPLGIMKTGLFPVWKRASVATEMDFDIDGLPSFIIDTATREGMSGSPVFARSTNSYITRSNSMSMGSGPYNQFLGVYSGRYVGGIDEAHLGKVWKKKLIDEIAVDPASGTFELRS